MAKQYGSYMGGFSGKLGPAIGYMWNGRWCVRSRPTQVHNPRTEAQEAHRTAFRQQVQLAARMRWAVVHGLTPTAREYGMTAYNLFVHLNQQCFSMREGRLEVDWSRLQLSVGPVAPVAVEETVMTEGNVLRVRFQKNPMRVAAGMYDQVRLYVYDPEEGNGWMAAPVYRRDQRVEVALPDELAGRALQLFLMVEDAAGRQSPTAHGEVGAQSVESDGEVTLTESTENRKDMHHTASTEKEGWLAESAENAGNIASGFV